MAAFSSMPMHSSRRLRSSASGFKGGPVGAGTGGGPGVASGGSLAPSARGVGATTSRAIGSGVCSGSILLQGAPIPACLSIKSPCSVKAHFFLQLAIK